MLHEYPDYCDDFTCIAGDCPDTCCAGWEVDIDRYTKELYDGAPGEFGERLRANMTTDGEDCFFCPTADNRCPFLNQKNLCDIIIELGEDGISQVCTEYPRFFTAVGGYEQYDMSLSCMELGRIFFTKESPIEYVLYEDDEEEYDASPEQMQRLRDLLPKRADLLDQLAKMSLPDFEDFMEQEESDDELLSLMAKTELLDSRWTRQLELVTNLLEYLPEGSIEADFRNDMRGKYPHLLDHFRRLAMYFLFRYYIDAVGEDEESELLLMRRSVRFIYLMCIGRWLEQNRRFTVEDMIDVAHLYSKQIEHSPENVQMVKGL